MVDSPDVLGRGGRGAGVRRLNRRPLIVVGAILCLILLAVSYTYQLRLAEQRRRSAAQIPPEPVETPAILKDAPDGFIAPRRAERLEAPPAPALVEKPVPAPVPQPDPNAEEWERWRREREQRRQAREQAMLQAMRAATPLKTPAVASARSPGGESAPSQAPAVSGQLASLYATEALRQRALVGSGEEPDLNRAAEKRAFLNDRIAETGDAHYLPGGREVPRSPYELKAGTVIPATMIGGINSDLPRQILGQVAENIFDSATGRFILIPQGAKLVGTYDNAVTTGQERVLVAWTRIIYPDASSVDLGKMPGTDQAGLAGMHDQVNTHFWKMFSSALMLSVLSAGAQISQGGQSPSANGLDAQQSIAAGLGQQFGQLGQELARRNARIQPTLEIRPGYRFTISVTADMVLRPWIPRQSRR
jgi:type IV secretory pathway VirB10-like protein